MDCKDGGLAISEPAGPAVTVSAWKGVLPVLCLTSPVLATPVLAMRALVSLESVMSSPVDRRIPRDKASRCEAPLIESVCFHEMSALLPPTTVLHREADLIPMRAGRFVIGAGVMFASVCVSSHCPRVRIERAGWTP